MQSRKSVCNGSSLMTPSQCSLLYSLETERWEEKKYIYIYNMYLSSDNSVSIISSALGKSPWFSAEGCVTFFGPFSLRDIQSYGQLYHELNLLWLAMRISQAILI